MMQLAIRSALFGRPGAKLTAALAGILLASCGGSGSSGSAATNNSGLWIANGTNVLEYIPSQLAAGTTATAPHLMNVSGAFGAPQGVTFDSAGNLWVMDPQANVNGKQTPTLLKFSSAQLTALSSTNSPSPVAVITSASLAFPQQSVFDKAGNQWVADHNNNTVVVFTVAQLGMTGTNDLTPAVVLSSADFNGPLGIVFDSAGNLWVANNGGVPGANNTPSPAGTTIVEFAAGHLPAVPTTGMSTPSLTPDVVLTDDGNGSIQAPWALLFDSAGNLFSSNANPPNTVVEFAKASLMTSGTPTPAVTISPAMVNGIPSLNAPNGLCFDNLGDLAALDSAGAYGLAFYTKGQLVTSGAVVPSTFIVGTGTQLNAPAGCNFGPLIN
jgi:hypothetical protein